MKLDLIVRPEAEADLSIAFKWYEQRRSGLGYDFLLNIDAGFHFIIRNPNSHPSEYKDTRTHLIKRFPYKIIYLIDNEKVIILAVLHCRQNFDLIKNRILNTNQ